MKILVSIMENYKMKNDMDMDFQFTTMKTNLRVNLKMIKNQKVFMNTRQGNRIKVNDLTTQEKDLAFFIELQKIIMRVFGLKEKEKVLENMFAKIKKLFILEIGE